MRASAGQTNSTRVPTCAPCPRIYGQKTLQMRVTCGTLHGTPTLPASGAPSITPTGGCPLRPQVHPQHQVHLPPLASGMWCPCYLCLGPLCPPEDKPGSVAGGGEPPQWSRRGPRQGGGPSPERHNQLAGLQVTAEAGLSPAERRPTWPTPDARGMRDARCLTPLRAGRLVTQLPCGHSWPMRRGRGSAHSGVTEGVSQGQASLTPALPRKFPSQTSHSLGRLCHFYFFFPFLVRWGQGRVFETKHSIFLS